MRVGATTKECGRGEGRDESMAHERPEMMVQAGAGCRARATITRTVMLLGCGHA